MAGWLAGWLAGWMAGWLAGWMDGWMAGWVRWMLPVPTHGNRVCKTVLCFVSPSSVKCNP